MLRKITILLILFTINMVNVNASIDPSIGSAINGTIENTETKTAKMVNDVEIVNNANSILANPSSTMKEKQKALSDKVGVINRNSWNLSKAELETLKGEVEAQIDAICAETKDCIDKTSFIIKVDDISPWMAAWAWDTKENVNFLLWTIIQNLMIALWSLALFVMTVWAWYILLHHWEDEFLSKWKTIFMSGVYALIVSLGSYYLISIVRYILFT